jgi:hypothetical protein
MITNAKDKELAQVLSSHHPGSFTGIVVRKAGEVRKGVLYGDDLIRVTLRTGTSYKKLVQKSLDILKALSPTALCKEAVHLGLTDAKTGNLVNIADVYTAIQEIEDSFKRVISGSNVAVDDDEPASNFEPLLIDGRVVPGAKVYTNPDSDKHGSVYLMGIKIAEKVLSKSPTGDIPTPKSSGKTLAKNLIKSKLPIGKIARYRLNGNFILKCNGQTLTRVSKAIGIDEKQQDDLARQLF